MSIIAKTRGQSVAKPIAAASISPDLRAVADAVRQGVPMLARDLTPGRIAEAKAVVSAGLSPAPEALMVAWLTDLAMRVANAPDRAALAGNASRVLCETCADFPAGVWTRETLSAWVKQGEKGKFWPYPADLYAHLLPYAERLRRNVEGCRKIVRLAEQVGKREEGVSEAERKAVAAKMAAWRASHPDAEPERRRPEVKLPSVSERIAEYRRQIEADPTAAEWLLPMIERLKAQATPKNQHSAPHSAMKPLSAYVGAGNHQRAV